MRNGVALLQVTDYARWGGDMMWDSCRNRIFVSGLFKEIEEPVISSGNAVFIQNSSSSSKITVYNINTGKTKSVCLKGMLCFNIHSYNNYIVFEFSGEKRGIGIFDINTWEIKKIDYALTDIILGGMWKNHIVLRRGYEIILYDIAKNSEKTIASCRHIFGVPAIGYEYCVWLQRYKDRCCIVLYNIADDKNIIFASSGYINKLYIIEGNIVYQNCTDNICGIYVYNISECRLTKCFESPNWIEPYMGRDNTMVWTVRKECQGKYLFDIYIYNIYNNKISKILSDYNNTVIPAVSNELLLWVDANIKGDSLYMMPIDYK